MKRLIAFAGACLVVACFGDTEPNAALLVLGSTSPTSIQAGQTLTIDLTIFNNGTQPVQIALSQCVPPYEVLTSNGTVVGPGTRMCPLDQTAPVTIASQASVQYSTTWTGDSSGTGPADGFIYLKPGTYHIRPRVNVVAGGSGYSYGAVMPVTITP